MSLFSEKLKQYMEQHSLSIYQAGDKLKVSALYIERWLEDRNLPSSIVQVALLKFFDRESGE